MTAVNRTAQWWSLASVVNHTVVTDTKFRQPGFSLTHQTWPLLNCFWPVMCKPAQMGSSKIIDMRLWPAADYELYCQHVSVNEI